MGASVATVARLPVGHAEPLADVIPTIPKVVTAMAEDDEAVWRTRLKPHR
jgi:hypothetical protein